jgi:pimeloyl-ACP methyl ester carboxylesterase
VAEVDRIGTPVVLVGHSGGGAVAHAVVDARPDSVRHVIYVDSGPMADGGRINPDLPARDGVIPLPEWTGFEEQELVGLDGPQRSDFRARAIDQPARVATDRQQLSDDRRFEVPVTVITSTFPSEVLQEMMAAGHPYLAELARIREVTVIDLPTGHWPQFTRPDELAVQLEAVLERVGR